MKPLKRDTIELVESVSLASPAVRMMIVQAYWASEDDHCTFKYPVVALQASVVKSFSRLNRGTCTHEAATVAQLLAEGWHGEASDARLDYLVPDDECGGLVAARLAFDGENMAYEVVCCCWPQADDDVRLLPVAARVQALAEERGRPFMASRN